MAEQGGRLAAELDAPEIHWKDITRIQDDWSVEAFVSQSCMGTFLHHLAFKLLLAGLIVCNAITVGLRTEPRLDEKYFGLFSAIDTVVLAVLICEVLLNWYYGFWLYWKDGWNIINFLIVVFLFLGLFLSTLISRTFFHMVRVMRLLQVCTLVSGLARMLQVILQSIPDMVTIILLLFSIMLVFSVFGVTLFGSIFPQHFGNLGTALYSLFICVTQDGWLNIYEDFTEESMALNIGGALYFIVFITCGAFICANLLVAVVTSNLEQCMAEYQKQRQLQAQGTPYMLCAGYDDGADDYLPVGQPQLEHVRKVIHGTHMAHQQDMLSYGNLGNLNDVTFEDFCLVLEAIHENLKEYRAIRDELNLIVQEVRSIGFNIEQEQEVVLRNIRGSNQSDALLATDSQQVKTGSVLKTLLSLEKSNIIDMEYQKGAMKSAALRARRQSSSVENSAEKSQRHQDSLVTEGQADRSQRHRDSVMAKAVLEAIQKRHLSLSSGSSDKDRNLQESLVPEGPSRQMPSQRRRMSMPQPGQSPKQAQKRRASLPGQSSDQSRRHQLGESSDQSQKHSVSLPEPSGE